MHRRVRYRPRERNPVDTYEESQLQVMREKEIGCSQPRGR